LETAGTPRRFRRRPRHAARVACVYLLRCADGSLYCGWTVDVAQRLAAHNAARASRYTRSRLPVELVWWRPMPDRATAQREELRIKGLSRPEKLALIGGAKQMP
jgi:putative endonuclease